MLYVNYSAIKLGKKYKEIQKKNENLVSVTKNIVVVLSVASGAKPSIKLTLPRYVSMLCNLAVPHFPLILKNLTGLLCRLKVLKYAKQLEQCLE